MREEFKQYRKTFCLSCRLNFILLLTYFQTPVSNPFSVPHQCGTINDQGPNEGLTERSLQDAQRLYLMNDVVQPESVDPLVMQDDVRFSNLVVDIVQGMDRLYHVIYISTGW